MDAADAKRRHESVDHVDPTDAGLMEPEGDDAPGTGIMGDETVVRDVDDGRPPGVYPAPPAHTGGLAHPGPTPANVEDEIERPEDLR
jgi:hypothetical protein